MTIEDLLCGDSGYRVHSTEFLPYNAMQPDGSTKRVDTLIDHRARAIWLSKEAMEALTAKSKPLTFRSA